MSYFLSRTLNKERRSKSLANIEQAVRKSADTSKQRKSLRKRRLQ